MAKTKIAKMTKTAPVGRKRVTKFSVGGSGYDAVKAKNRREAPNQILRSEDGELKVADRRKLVSSTRNLHRNFVLAGWMIRRHLDYVSTFNFQSRTGDKKLDKIVEAKVAEWSQPENFEVTGRFSLPKFIRLAEMRRTVDHDMLILKISNGLVQAIEGDRVRTPEGGMPDGMNAADFTHGVKVNEFGRPTQFAICQRGKTTDAGDSSNRFTFERLLDAKNVYHFGYFDRFDQVRGVSPLASAINSLRDTYEGFDYALARMKVDQLFSLVLFRKQADELGTLTAPAEDSDDESSEANEGYQIDFGRGPTVLDLDPGDDAKFLTGASPSTQFQDFSQVMIGVALKALDIPYSFYAENFSNYSGSRGALLQYELSAKIKRTDVRALLDNLTKWRLNLFIQDKELNADPAQLKWEWIPTGTAWIDPLKEINADIAAVGAGLNTRTRILKEQGIVFDDLLDELEHENKSLLERGLSGSVSNVTPITDDMTDGNAGPNSGNADPNADDNADPNADPSGNAGGNSGNANEMSSDINDLKTQLDLYGIGVRAGSLTPQIQDEEYFRKLAKLPGMSPDAQKAWQAEKGGVRRPITLTQDGGKVSPNPIANEN